tara:strand:- start:1762 stop:2235 length:474 start_codon:yes stop_codon:yes gene_type:complete
MEFLLQQQNNYMSGKKIRILPDQYVFSENDKGDKAYLIISGSFDVERDGKKVGKMSEGEIFGELSLILGENRKASVKAVVPSELAEISPNALNELLLSSSLEIHKLIKEFSLELKKNEGYALPISLDKLKVMVENEPNIIRALALQLHWRLSQMIYS